MKTRTDAPAPSRTVPIEDNSRVALGLLRHAHKCAHDTGENLWDFALDINTLFKTGLTMSDLRWLVAKGFAEHGQELSVYGDPHRTFRPGNGFFFAGRTCAVLTPDGVDFVDQFLGAPGGSSRTVPQIGTALKAGESAVLEKGPSARHEHKEAIDLASKPRWNPTRRELRLDDMVVKRFRVPAQNQELILNVFEEERWPDHIDDPLPVSRDIDPRIRLHDTINRLNGCQTNPLLRFHGNGTGTGVCWNLRRTVVWHETHRLVTASH